MEQPKIPTLKDSQKPQVKIKGLAAGMSLFDRLKTFKKKDLAFILAGLGTLFMAPLAEHFMMAPESGDGTMQQGWGGKGGSNLFGSGSSPYESGITGLAPGGAIGGGGDVITPLNVRDPSALVMGPGATQQPPAGSIVPQTPPPASSKEPDLKDALANAAARAAGAATRKAPVPVPKPAMTGSGLRGLGVASGGSSAGAGLAPINSAGLSTNRAAASNSLGDVRPSSSYRGVARGPGKGSGGSEALKAAAGGAGDLFNKGGSAAGNAEQAAQVAMPGGNAFGGGNGGAGGADKGPGGNNSNGSKSVGESLEFLRQKQEMEKALDLKWKMKEKRAMFPLELQQEAAKTIVMDGVVKPLASGFGDLMKNLFTNGSKTGFQCTEGFIKLSEVKTDAGSAALGSKDGKACVQGPTSATFNCYVGGAGTPIPYTNCRFLNTPGGATPGTETPEETARREAQNNPFASPVPATAPSRTLTQVCTSLGNAPGTQAVLTRLKNDARTVSAILGAMQPGMANTSCSVGASAFTDPAASGSKAVSEEQTRLWNDMKTAADALKTQNQAVSDKYTQVDTKVKEIIKDQATTKNGEAKAAADAAEQQILQEQANAGAVKTAAEQFAAQQPSAADAAVNKARVVQVANATTEALDTGAGALTQRVSQASTQGTQVVSRMQALTDAELSRELGGATAGQLTDAKTDVTALRQWAVYAQRVVEEKNTNNGSLRTAAQRLTAAGDAVGTTFGNANNAINAALAAQQQPNAQQPSAQQPSAQRETTSVQQFVSTVRQNVTAQTDTNAEYPSYQTLAQGVRQRSAGALQGFTTSGESVTSAATYLANPLPNRAGTPAPR